MWKSSAAFARSISVLLTRRAGTPALPPAAPPHTSPPRAPRAASPPAPRLPALAKAALAATLTGWLSKLFALPRTRPTLAMTGADAVVAGAVVPTEPLYAMRALPPFNYYPLLSKETLVHRSEDPDRNTFAVVRLTFAYLPGGLDLDSATHNIKVIRPGFYKPRSYTPTRAHQPGTFDLTVKVYPGGSSEWLAALPIGTSVGFIGPLPLPIKRVAYEPAERSVVVALGIGITLGIAAVRKELAAGRNATLVQAVRYSEEAVFQKDIEELKAMYGSNFEVRYIASGEKVDGWDHGRVTDKYLKDCVGDTSDDDIRFLVVGTKTMMRQVWAMLGKLGYSYRKHALVKK